MPVAIISSKEYDLETPVEINAINNSSNWDSVERRVTRLRTLDGGAQFVDHGFAQADRDMTFDVPNITEELVNRFQEFVQLHPRLVVSISGGVFEAVPVSYNTIGNNGSFRVHITAKLDA